MNNIMYRIKNIFFFFFLAGYIKLIPNVLDTGLIGIVFLWLGVIYTLLMFVCYVKKNKNLNDNIIQNILSILLYLYIFLISSKYIQTVNLNIDINILYFKTNYVISSILIIGICINSYILIREKNK